MLSAGLAAVGGLIIAMRLQAGTATAGTGLELKAIAAVVLGGTSLFGGKGTVVGSVLGVYTLAFIENGLVLNHVDPFYFNIIQGGDPARGALAQHGVLRPHALTGRRARRWNSLRRRFVAPGPRG